MAMPQSGSEQIERRDAIRQLLAGGRVATQKALVEALTEQGIAVTQSSVSRDLRDLGAVKTAAGYELPGSGQDDDGGVREVAGLIRRATPAGGNLLVVHTAVGAAQRVALAFDRSGWPEIVGNIGGDDTVFVATASAGAQRLLLGRIDRLLAA